FTLPLGPIVRLPFVRLSLPSTMPSTKRSSLPVTSPLILIPWLMQAEAREETGTGAFAEYGCADAAVVAVEFTGVVGISGTDLLFESSYFHVLAPRHRIWIFEAAFRRTGGEPRI